MNRWLQAISVSLIIILVMNIVLFALGLITQLMLWSVIIVSAIVSYKIAPKINHPQH